MCTIMYKIMWKMNGCAIIHMMNLHNMYRQIHQMDDSTAILHGNLEEKGFYSTNTGVSCKGNPILRAGYTGTYKGLTIWA